MRSLPVKHCASCERAFVPTTSTSLYCSRSCATRSRHRRNGSEGCEYAFSFSVRHDMATWLRYASKRFGCGISDVIRQALDEYREAVEENDMEEAEA